MTTTRYVYDSEKTDVWALGFIYFQLRTGLHLREADVLRFEGREHEVFTPKTDAARANDLFWTTCVRSFVSCSGLLWLLLWRLWW